METFTKYVSDYVCSFDTHGVGTYFATKPEHDINTIADFHVADTLEYIEAFSLRY